MKANNVLKLLFVINPGAGSNQNAWEEIIANYFKDKNFNICFHELEKPVNIKKLEQDIESQNPNQVIAVGGDGTIALIAGIIAGTKMALGIIPAGSANGMAKELNIPEDPEQALSVIESGLIKPCDAIKINNKFNCIHLSDIGLNAQLIKYFDEGKLRGKLGYASVVLKTIWRKKRMQVSIEGDHETIHTDALMIVLANASKYGTGAVINPDGKLDDGLFEVVIIKRISISYLLRVFFRYKQFDPKHAAIFHAKTVSIDTKKSMHFQVDGEYKGKITHIDAAILPGYINIILPAAGNES